MANSPSIDAVTPIANAGAGDRPHAPSSDGMPLPALGAGAIVLGGMGLVACPFLHLAGPSGDGSLPAISLVVILLGFALRFPTLLQDGTTDSNNQGNVSTMRVAVLGIVIAFLLVTVKAGWGATSLGELQIDPSWRWILGVALGGKATQSFAEMKPSA